MRCDNCGAQVRNRSAAYCEFCGAALPKAPTQKPQPFGDLEARFAALEVHPELPAHMRYEPSIGSFLLPGAMTVGVLAIFLAVTGFMTLFTLAIFPPFAIFTAAMFAFGVFLLVKTLNQASKFTSSKLERRPALVLDERSHVSGSSDSTRTRYYVSLESRDGKREELSTTGQVSGTLTRGDLGIAYIRADTLLDFRRVDV